MERSQALVNKEHFPWQRCEENYFRLIKGRREHSAPGLLVKRDSSWIRAWVAEAIGR